MSRTARLLLPVLLFPMSLAVVGQAPEPIGSVRLLQGSAEASAATGMVRRLVVGSEVHAGDTLTTADNGHLMLDMRDAALLALRPGTQLNIERYDPDNEPASTGLAVIRLAQGAVRLISGTIGQQAEGAYRIVTPLALVESTRADQEVMLSRGVLYNRVYYGTSSVSNAAGSVRLGQGGDHDNTETLPGQAPVGLLEWPLEP